MNPFLRVLLSFGFLAFILGATSPLAAQASGNTQGTKENLDLPYDAIGEDDLDEDAPEIIEFYGQSYEGDGVVFVIDRSGSMQSSGELNIAKREVIKNIREFSSRVHFGVVFFDRDILKFPQSGNPAQADPAMKQAGSSWVQGVAGGGGSCCQAGLMQGLQILNKAPVEKKTLIYLGDGGGTCGGDEAQYLQTTLGVVKSQNYQHATINTIGVLMASQPDHCKQFLRQLASGNGGRYSEITR